MSAKTNMKNLQYHKGANGISSESQVNIRNMSNKVLPLGFPPSKSVLWDSIPMGDAIGLHLSYYRNPRLLVAEKALRLSYRHAKTERKSFSCFLLGSFSVDEDEEGVTLTIERFDPGREKSGGSGKIPSALLPGELVIPCTVSGRESQTACKAALTEDFASSLTGLQSHLHSKEALDVSKLLSVRAHLTYTEDMDNIHFDLHWAAVTVANTFESTPIKAVPIIPTALARNLSSHNNIAQLQGTHKCGYLTMDQTRKLLLVLESDPKVYTLPLVGIWLSGVTHVHSAQVWSSCLRYMFSSSINDRVLSESGSFLIILYSLTHKEPEFYECKPSSGHDPLTLQLLTCEDALHLFKSVESSRKPLQFELMSGGHSSETYFFNEVSRTVSTAVSNPNTSSNKLSVTEQDSGVEVDDFSPRPSPRPHPSVQQAMRIHPSVPELSLVFGSFIDSKSVSQNTENNNRENLPQLNSSTRVNANIPPACSSPPPSKKMFSKCQRKDSSSKPLPINVPSKTQTLKPYKGKPSQADKWNGQVRRNSASSSSSSSSSSVSTPRNGSSPSNTVHQIKGSSDHISSCNMAAPQQGAKPLRRSFTPCRQSPSPQSSNHNVTFPLHSRHHAEPSNMAPFYQPNDGTCCHNHGPVQCHSPGSWPSPDNISHHTVDNPSESFENIYSSCQRTTCPSVCCSPVCENCQTGSGPPGRIGCSHSSPGRRDSVPVNSCSPRSCVHSSPPMVSSANGMLGLSTEAYRLLADQDKQLKVLQAQIERLLKAQTSQSQLSRAGGNSGVSHKPDESVSTETTGVEKKTSVSIAVSTGASLFWNSSGLEEGGERQDDSALCNELSVAGNHEEVTSHSSIASSLQAVDICSFSDSSQLVDNGHTQNNHSVAPLGASHLPAESCSPTFQHKVQMSASVGLQVAPIKAQGKPGAAEPEPSVPCVPQGKLYQNLLNQVNNLLKTSTDENESTCTGDGTNGRSITSESQSKPSQTESNNVLKATLRQLKSIGVNIDLETSEGKRSTSDTADCASILACINPDAVIPRLNYMSFTNMDLSGFVPSGVDLSMEANAIALKYLSESQLRQLSHSHVTKSSPLDSSSFHNLMPGNADKNMVGLSLISSNNMSFATKKYMKRYGLLESTDLSDDESATTSESSDENEKMEKNRQFPNPPYTVDVVEDGDGLKQTGKCTSRAAGHELVNPPNTLRNITNKIAEKSEETALQFFKDIKPESRPSSGKAQFTRHPEKENSRDSPVLPEKDSASSGKRNPNSLGVHGEILDLNHLRQLRKLF
ncbi:SCL-interrupting locus protein [Discoglossus pictus]